MSINVIKSSKHHCYSLRDCNDIVRKLGYEVAVNSTEDNLLSVSFSEEKWSERHPKVCVMLCKKSGKLTIIHHETRPAL